jgi:hypothetical protein
MRSFTAKATRARRLRGRASSFPGNAVRTATDSTRGARVRTNAHRTTVGDAVRAEAAVRCAGLQAA